MDFQVCQPQKTRVLCHLKLVLRLSSQVTWEESRGMRSRTDCNVLLAGIMHKCLQLFTQWGGITLSQPVNVAICMVTIAKKSTYYDQNQMITAFHASHSTIIMLLPLQKTLHVACKCCLLGSSPWIIYYCQEKHVLH